MADSIKDVARLAGVSTATVSRVISNKKYLSDEIKSRVLAAMQELNYHPSRTAQSLRSKRSQIIGLLISDIQGYLFQSIARAVEDIAYNEHHTVFLCNTDENIEKARIYVELLKAEGVAGVIVSPTVEYNDPCRALIEAGIPVVTIDRKLSDIDIDSVVVDNNQGAFEGVDHLIKDGYDTIGAVLGNLGITTSRERQAGYEQALKASGIPVRPELIRWANQDHTIGNRVVEAGYQLTRELLTLPDRPRALFTGNNLLTTGALKAMEELDLNCPDDVALVGFDNNDWMSFFRPAITVVVQPAYEVGKLAVEQLLKRIGGDESQPQHIVAKTKLIVRRSCGTHS